MNSDVIAVILGGSLLPAILVYVGSYVGIFKKTNRQLPFGEKTALFIFFWILCAIVQIILRAKFQLVEGDALWATIILGIVIGRPIVSWRSAVYKSKQLEVKSSEDEPAEDKPTAD